MSLHEDVAPTKFTVREHEKVVVTLDVIKGLLIAYAKDNERAINGISKDIGELKELAKEQDRKSFFNQVVGYLINTATSMALAPDQTRALFEKLKQGFEALVKFLR